MISPDFSDVTHKDAVDFEVPSPPDEDDERPYDDDPAVQLEYRREVTTYEVASTLRYEIEHAKDEADKLSAQMGDIFHKGNGKGTPYEAWTLKVERDLPAPYKVQANGLLKEIESLAKEKGFIYTGSIMSYNEHTAIGSGTGRIYRETDPDMPVALVKQSLVKEGKREPDPSDEELGYTTAEIDKARRLIGMTKLDLTSGMVTGEIDEQAARDPYHFLTPERREKVIRREGELATELQSIYASVLTDAKDSAALIISIDKYMDGQLTSEEIQALYQELVIRKGFNLSLDKQIKQAKQISFDSGSRDMILTPQEILLRVGAAVDDIYLQDPHIPLAVQDGLMNVEEVQQLRTAEGTMAINTDVLGHARPYYLKLEELDNVGKTSLDPTLMGHDGNAPESDEILNYFAHQMRMPLKHGD